MPGNDLNKAIFSDLWYMKGSDSYYQRLTYKTTIDRWGSDNESEWGYDWDTISTTKYVEKILVWDKAPIP